MRESIGDVDANIEYVSDSQLLQFRKVVSYILGANQQLLCSRADCLALEGEKSRQNPIPVSPCCSKKKNWRKNGGKMEVAAHDSAVQA